MPTSLKVRGRPVSRQGEQYARLLNARRSLQEVRPLAWKPTVRAQIATAIGRIDDAIGRIEGRAAANSHKAERLLQLDLDLMRLRRPPVRR